MDIKTLQTLSMIWTSQFQEPDVKLTQTTNLQGAKHLIGVNGHTLRSAQGREEPIAVHNLRVCFLK